MASNSGSYSSMRSLLPPLSIRSETKEKFDALLKAGRKKRSQSKVKLLDEEFQTSTSASSEILQEKEIENEKNIELTTLVDQNKSYILNKFLDGQTTSFTKLEELSDKTQCKQPPVPKPRKKVHNNVTTDNNHDQSPTISHGTFKVTSPQAKKDEDSVSSNKTYNLLEEVGDVLIHENSLHSKIIVKTESNRFLEKGDIETLSDHTGPRNEDNSMKTSSSSIHSSKSKIQEAIERKETKSASEIPKLKRRSKKQNKSEDIDEVSQFKKSELLTSEKETEVKSQKNTDFIGSNNEISKVRSKSKKQSKSDDGSEDLSQLKQSDSSSSIHTSRKTKIQETDVNINEAKSDFMECNDDISKLKSKKSKKRISESIKETSESKNKMYNYEKIIEIVVHNTDRLQLNSLVIHPVVKIHIVDISTGKYFPKSDKSRSVVFFYENKDCDYISPVMTHTYNLQEKRILFPSWEEAILINEDFEYFKDQSDQIIIFFEILDFVSSSDLHQSSKKNCKKGWYNIAFAFLKLSSKSKSCLNFNKKLRLQLYHSQSKGDDPRICSAWFWWKSKKLEKYPSTLYVSVNSTSLPSEVPETFRSKTPIQRETSSKAKIYEDFKKEVPETEPTIINNTDEFNIGKTREIHPWSKSFYETCKLPNKCLTKLDTCEDGCFITKFSNKGVFLAIALGTETLYYISIFSIESLKEINKFSCHQGLIYDIKWSHDDTLLIAASADNTVSIFSLSNYLFLQILPHPSFVYACDISPDNIIVSGCYDAVLRLWSTTSKKRTKTEFQLFQELENHKGFITSVCFNKNSNILSADSTGAINEWIKEGDYWVLQREIQLLDLRETIINQILLFPKEKRLLVNSRDSTIRVIDLKSGCVLQWFRGALNKRIQTFCSISACGTYIYSGSENGCMYIWNSKNGHEVASCVPYKLNNHNLIINCVQCHPFDNIVVISSYGNNLPILIYCYDKNVNQAEIDITVRESNENDQVNKRELPKEFKFSRADYETEEECNIKYNFNEILQKMDTLIDKYRKL